MLTYKRLRQVLKYNPRTGLFIWRKTLSLRGIEGRPAGAPHGGIRNYIKIGIDGRRYYAHRLAWFYVTGNWPDKSIDHIDGDPQNNRISNLRLATFSENTANQSRRAIAATGMRGVYSYSTTGKLFEAKAMYQYRIIRFGIFKTREEAYSAYKAGMKRLFGTFSPNL